MIITLAGKPGSGKSTVAKLVAKRLGFKHHSTGDFMRWMAEERKITLLDLSKIAEEDQSVDEELDQWQIDLGRKEDNFVIDGRLSWHFIPQSFKVFVDADFNVRSERIFHDHIRKEHNVTLESSKEHLKTREASEKKRYKEYYHLDPYDKTNFDLVIDSSKISAEEVADEIVKAVKKS